MRMIISTILILSIFSLISCGQGVYNPGNLKDSVNLIPPIQDDDNPHFWKMDENTELYHFSQGDSEGIPVIMLHGGPAIPFPEPWPGLDNIEGYQFHYYHQRGCGSSTIPFKSFESKNYKTNMDILEEKLGMDRHLEDIEKIRKILGMEKIILIGHSFGGFMAALYAIEFPDQLEKMILVEPADMMRFPPASGGLNQIEPWLAEDQRTLYQDYIKDYFSYGKFFKRTEEELAAMNREYGKYYIQALKNRYPEKSNLLEGVGAPVNNGGFAGHAPFFSLGRKYDYRELLGDIDVPVLVIHGTRDLYGPEASREYASFLPNGVYNELENSSHFPFYEEQKEFRRLVEKFLND